MTFLRLCEESGKFKESKNYISQVMRDSDLRSCPSVAPLTGRIVTQMTNVDQIYYAIRMRVSPRYPRCWRTGFFFDRGDYFESTVEIRNQTISSAN